MVEELCKSIYRFCLSHPPFQVSGMVRLLSSEPAAACALVWKYDRSDQSGKTTPVYYMLITDADGRFRITDWLFYDVVDPCPSLICSPQKLGSSHAFMILQLLLPLRQAYQQEKTKCCLAPKKSSLRKLRRR